MIYKFNGHKIELYDSIQNLSISRFNKFNKYQMIASEVGNTFEDYDARTLKIVELLKKKLYNEAIQELENRRQTAFNAFNEFVPVGNAFALLVKKIDKKKYDDYSPDSLKRCVEHLDKIGLSNLEAMERLKEVKKKSKRNLLRTILIFFQKEEIKNLTP